MGDQSKPNGPIAPGGSSAASPRNLAVPKICHNPDCGFQTYEPLSTCPECGRPIWTTYEFRLLSSLLIFLGFILLGAGGGLGYLAYGIYTDKSSWAEGYGSGAVVIGAIAVFISVLGLATTTAGVWQVIAGSANRRLIIILVTLLFSMFAFAFLGRMIFSFFDS